MIGTVPLGSPFGVGTPAVAPSTPSPKDIGTGARFLTVRGDYEIDPETKQFRTMPPVRQRFLLLIRIARNSIPSRPDDGIDMPQKMDETFEERVRASVRSAARQMTHVEQVAKIRAITITRRPAGRATILIAYTDLTTQVNELVHDTV